MASVSRARVLYAATRVAPEQYRMTASGFLVIDSKDFGPEDGLCKGWLTSPSPRHMTWQEWRWCHSPGVVPRWGMESFLDVA